MLFADCYLLGGWICTLFHGDASCCRHAVSTPTPSERREKIRQPVSVGFGGCAPTPSRSPAKGKSLSPAVSGHMYLPRCHIFLTSPNALPVHAQRTRRSTPPRRAGAGTQQSRTSSERTPKSESPVQRQETRCSTVKQGTLHKLASGAAAEGGWLSLGSSHLPRSTSDARMDSKNDIDSWHPQQVKIELTQTSFATTESPRQHRIVTAAFHFCPPGQVEGQSATAKIQLESSSDIKYEQEATDFTVVRDCKARELILLAVHCRGSKSSLRACWLFGMHP